MLSGSFSDVQQVHYSTDGWLLHVTSDEAKKQNDLTKLEAELTAKFQASSSRCMPDCGNRFVPRLVRGVHCKVSMWRGTEHLLAFRVAAPFTSELRSCPG